MFRCLIEKMKYIQVLPKYRTARTKPIIYNHGKFVMHYAYNSRRKHAVPKAKKGYIYLLCGRFANTLRNACPNYWRDRRRPVDNGGHQRGMYMGLWSHEVYPCKDG